MGFDQLSPNGGREAQRLNSKIQKAAEQAMRGAAAHGRSEAAGSPPSWGKRRRRIGGRHFFIRFIISSVLVLRSAFTCCTAGRSSMRLR
mgnify:CR=1 FL=1